MSNEPITKETALPQKKKAGKYILYLLLIFGLTAVVLGFSLSGDIEYHGQNLPAWKAIGIMFSDMPIYYIFIFAGMLLLLNLIAAFGLYLFARLYTRRYKYHQAFANQMVGTFYNDITPGLNSGGQFAQAYTFKKQGLHISNAASVLVMQYIVYQTCLLLLGLISLVKIDKVLSIEIIKIGTLSIPIVVFVILGFCLNATIIITLLVMSYSRTIHNFILNHVVSLLGKMHVFRDPERKRDELRVQVENFRIELRRMQSNIPFTILIYIITFMVLIISDSFPYIVGLSLNAFSGSPTDDIWNRIFESIVFTNYHQMICGLVPIPGSAGVSEFVFSYLFSSYYTNPEFSSGGIKGAMLLWRLITYYVPFLISAVVAATYKSRGLKGEERFYPLDKDTFATLQLETYEDRKASSDVAYETKSLERKEILLKLGLYKKKDSKKTQEISIAPEILDENKTPAEENKDDSNE